jgi:hypothetical protein
MSGRGLKAFVIASVCALGSALGVLGIPGAALATGDANQANCQAETEASPGFRTFLPDCRAFELVTPPYKEGGIVAPEPGAISGDGSHVIVGVAGAFAGADNYLEEPIRNPENDAYEFMRTAGGWQPTSLTPPAGEYPESALMAVSAENFGETLWGAERANPLYPYVTHHEDIYLRTGAGASEFHRVGPGTPREGKGKEVLEGYELVTGEELDFVGASRDLTHSLYQIRSSPVSEREAHGDLNDLWPGDATEPGAESLYEYVYTGIEDPEPTLVGVYNEGSLHGSPLNEGAQLISDCGTELGSGESGSAYNAVSASGEVVFFTALECSGQPEVNELYARVAGDRTVAISEPSLPAGECSSGEPCAGAEKKAAVFQGASENGERVFFLGEQPLVNGAPASGVKLYEVRLEGAKVTEVVDISADPTAGQSPEVKGVARVSENGERVYFVANGMLAGTNRENQTPEASADNLYVYEPEPGHPTTYHTVFVAKLLTPSEETTLKAEEKAERTKVAGLASASGQRAEEEAVSRGVQESEAEEIGTTIQRREETKLRGTLGPSGTRSKDKSVWSAEDTRSAQATPDGSFFLFLSSTDLTEGDTSKVPQLFEYDAVMESLTRVSIGQASGNVSAYAEAPAIPEQLFRGVDLPTATDTNLALSEDGSDVFFTSAAPLAPQAQAHTTNVYEYRDGHVYLLSGGDASAPSGALAVTLFGADPSGHDVFFTTVEQLVPQDGETERAMYDAREGGGFPAPTLAPGCFGETCRGSSGAASQSQAPGSASQVGSGNLLPSAKVETKPKPHTGAQEFAKALKSCRATRKRRKRVVCESRARKRYGAKRSSTASDVKKRGQGR